MAEHPTHPQVEDISKKSDLFDEFAVKYEIPPLAIPTAA